MKRLFATALFLLLTLTLPACGQSMKQPDIKLNPHPKMRYEITLTIEDSPGPFESVAGYANFETDTNCVPEAPITAGNYGAKYPVGHSVLVALRPVGANTYQGTMYMDWPKDEDYYGLGVCRWRFSSFSASLKVGEVSFGPSMWDRDVVAQQSKTEYFAKRAYGDNSISDRHVSSLGTNYVATRIQVDFFSTTLSAKEHFE
ncbi:hypothetical protein [Variovorax fucosicus]|uniref:hypothetical protein n=1 Tax=Variovorax fucosicus TaxID=3053517 RepID=UPI00257862D8|nr:hypothetical protein [Variovorax sp. J22G47]MDM0058386.1 hypothetical protein [Variovorax sp. J22G47]